MLFPHKTGSIKRLHLWSKKTRAAASMAREAFWLAYQFRNASIALDEAFAVSDGAASAAAGIERHPALPAPILALRTADR